MPEHVAIGDVLAQLRDEFPDITISKIRFLESQGLVNPERTPSGYRKFYAADIERLRWILRQQKDHFLPLKVIKERLDDLGEGGGGAPTAAAAGADRAPARPRKGRATPGDRRGRRGRRVEELPDLPDDGADDEPNEAGGVPEGGVSLTRTELARAAGLDDTELAHLEEYGLVQPAYAGRDRALFDEHALAIARTAAAFMRHGIEPRHLRMYRAFADREAALFEQVLLPYRRLRNPEAAAKAEETLAELTTLGRRLRAALLGQAARRLPGG